MRAVSVGRGMVIEASPASRRRPRKLVAVVAAWRSPIAERRVLVIATGRRAAAGRSIARGAIAVVHRPAAGEIVGAATAVVIRAAAWGVFLAGGAVLIGSAAGGDVLGGRAAVVESTATTARRRIANFVVGRAARGSIARRPVS